MPRHQETADPEHRYQDRAAPEQSQEGADNEKRRQDIIDTEQLKTRAGSLSPSCRAKFDFLTQPSAVAQATLACSPKQIQTWGSVRVTVAQNEVPACR